ncbi:SpoIIE family protein phosphatase [Nonomuraea ceibae]|uniref:SpoIIE family protein phosphatase n=1 Tax=Nonomuraea ceibae TaxID=1935170 RepID=UPI001FE603C9|nr:SpoIIE family protein phosphatase [Nonomuraea ceibae]
MLVGVLADARFPTATTTLAPGDALLLYTGSPTEARTRPRRDSLYGDDALLGFAAATPPTPVR